MSSLCQAAYDDGTYDNIRSVADIRKQLDFRNQSRELSRVIWWAGEPVQFRAYLIRRCMTPAPGQLLVPVNEVRATANKNWSDLSEELKQSIEIELNRLHQSYQALR